MSGTITNTVTVTSGPANGQSTVTSPYTLAAGSEISVSSRAGYGITTQYAANFVPTIIDLGTVIESNSLGVGINLTPGNVSSGGYGGSLTVGSSAFVSAGHYGVEVSSPNGSLNSAYVLNEGTIINTSNYGGFEAALVFEFNTQGSVNNKGLIGGTLGAGVYFKTPSGTNDALTNSGTILGALSVVLNENKIGAGTVTNTGFIEHGVVLETGAGLGTVTNAGFIGTIGGAFGSDAIDSLNRGLLNLDPGQSLGGGIATFGAGSTLELSGNSGQVGTLANAGSYFGFTSLSVSTGADWAIGAAGSTTTFNGITNVSDFGTLNIAGSLASGSGTITNSVSIDMEGSLGGASMVDFTGTNTNNVLYDFGADDQIIFASLTSAGPGANLSDHYNTLTNILTVTETNASGVVVGFETVTVTGTSPLNSASFVQVAGPTGDTIVLGSTQLNNSGSIFIDNGEQITLSNTSGVDTIPVTFGSHGTSLALNVLDINGTVAGTNSPYQGTISGFGLNDDIVIGMSVLPSLATGAHVSLSYAGSLLSVTELSAAGTTIGSTTIDVGTGYAANSFVALLGTNGINIEIPATVDETPLTFNTTGTASFEDPTKYSGGLAPGNTIVAGETVVIASGAASIASTAPVTDNGTIIVAGTTLIASSGIAGAGSILLDNGGTLDLTSTLATTQGSNVNATTANVTFGTGGSVFDPNVLIQDSSLYGLPDTISGFGLNDIITAGPAVLAFRPGDSIVVSTGGNQLYVQDTTDGKFFGVNFNSAVSAANFVETFGTNGLNIETTATAAEGQYTFNSTGTSSFYSPSNYSGDVAPGYSIVSGEIVTIASGTASISSTAPVKNTGTILVNGTGSGIIDSSALTGNGTVGLSGGGTLTLANATGATTNTISFGAASAGTPNVLNLAGTGTASFGGVIAGMGANDTIDLGGSFLPTPASTNNVGLSFNSASDLLTISDTVGGTVYTDTLQFSGTVPGTFAASIVNGNIVITDVPCFAAGTRILTPDGQVAVEALKQGDEVLTMRDGSVQKIIWVGQRTIDLARHANPDKARPVIILAGAFGEGLPERDLKLSPDHALYIEGHLIEAKTLVNGATIIRDKVARFVTYHHIELVKHDVVLAEGLPAETYLDSGNRRNFESKAGPMILHPDFAAARREGACAKLVLDGEIVRAVRQTLLDRAIALGFQKIDSIDLVVKAGTEQIAAFCNAGLSDDRELTFVLPTGTKSISFISSTGIPAELCADPSDRRVLGVAIASLSLIANGRRVKIDLNDLAHAGFHTAESGHRWTVGNAQIDLPTYQGRGVLEVVLRGQATRWAASNNQRRYTS